METMKLEVPVEVPKNKWSVTVGDDGKLMVQGNDVLDLYELDDVMDNHIRMMEAHTV